jgi:hypothetical protein
MIYKGKQLTVVQAEMLVRTCLDAKYAPPAGSVAEKIWWSADWISDDVWEYIDTYVKDRPR